MTKTKRITREQILWDITYIYIYSLYHNDDILHILIDTGSGNRLSPNRQQTLALTTVVLLPIRPLGTNRRKIQFEVQNSSLKNYIWWCCLQNVSHFSQAVPLKPTLFWSLDHGMLNPNLSLARQLH